MIAAGFKKFLFLVGYKADMIEEYFGDGKKYNISIKYSYDGKVLKGTGGAICNAYPYLEKEFMVIYGDSFMDIDYEECLYRFSKGRKYEKDALMVIYQNHNNLEKSNVCVKDEEIILYDKHNKTLDMGYVDYGISIFCKKIFEEHMKRDNLDLAEVQNMLTREKKVSAHIVMKRFYEVGTKKSLEEFEAYAYQRFEMKRPAVFLDRDGVINEIVYNEETEQLDSPLAKEQIHFMEDVGDTIRKLNEAGFYVFIVTNQPAAAKGKTSLENLYDINRYCIQQLEQRHVAIEHIFMCPHYEHILKTTKETFLIQNCNCRKPKSGLLEKAAKKYNIDKEKSYMIGDSYTDVLAGKKFGVQTILLGNLKCDICRKLQYDKPEYICDNLRDAVEGIICRTNKVDTKENEG